MEARGKKMGRPDTAPRPAPGQNLRGRRTVRDGFLNAGRTYAAELKAAAPHPPGSAQSACQLAGGGGAAAAEAEPDKPSRSRACEEQRLCFLSPRRRVLPARLPVSAFPGHPRETAAAQHESPTQRPARASMGPTRKPNVCSRLSRRTLGCFSRDAGVVQRTNLGILRALVCQGYGHLAAEPPAGVRF
ncbi:hypothetical protein P7K49_013991 [Saguinus oedipus]|uniref:Uncharacterized protein n=1 Tax=Saguinus oedipus TaxID=9490 RepID=A0ABQ9VHL9_SAGOE|nr:hypothetical protein P7K49_013991 [Saguinus oedipus]